MPRMAVDKDYRFEGPDGPASLLDLFAGRRQLSSIGSSTSPAWKAGPNNGCGGCSFMADQVAHLAHLNARDTTFAYVSRAPQENIARLKERMGWKIPWYTLTDDFDKPTSASASGTAPTRSSARATRSSAPTSSTSAATRRWAARGPTWTSPHSGARRSGRTRPRATRRRRPDPWWNYHDEEGEGYAGCGRGGRPGAPPAPRRCASSATFQAPAQKVFDAWTSEEVMRRWCTPSTTGDDRGDVDLRVGGELRVVMRNPHEGDEYGGGGRYTEIDPPSAWRSPGSGTTTRRGR